MTERPIFAAFYEVLSKGEDRMIRRYRAEVAGGARGHVLEVGSGNGLNFSHYRDALDVTAVEPEPGMLKNAVPRAAAATVPVRLVRGSAEALPAVDGSVDTVILSLVMCSVPEPAAALAEVRRVLTPGGEVRFFEHIRASEPWIARWQDRLNRPYGFVAGGCNMNRDTLSALRLAGFAVRYRRLAYGPRFVPHVLGTARLP